MCSSALEFNLIPSMNIAENIFMGDKIGTKITPNFKRMHDKANEILTDLGVTIDSSTMVGELSTAQQQ